MMDIAVCTAMETMIPREHPNKHNNGMNLVANDATATDKAATAHIVVGINKKNLG